jgi:hypothetical protein
MKIRTEIPDDGLLAIVRHADGTGTRLSTYVSRGVGRRWVVGFDVDQQGIAKGGADCHKTLDSAMRAFSRIVVEKERGLAHGALRAVALEWLKRG